MSGCGSPSRANRELLSHSVDAHRRVLGRVPRMVAADAGSYSREQKRMVLEKGVRRLAVPVKRYRRLVGMIATESSQGSAQFISSCAE
jgi:hypothetical protein